MAQLTAKKRKRIPKQQFALGNGRYPIHDKAHARNALARVAQRGTPSEKARVRAAVHRKYPDIGNTTASGPTTRSKATSSRTTTRKKKTTNSRKTTPTPRRRKKKG